jgi:hypothetical protein
MAGWEYNSGSVRYARCNASESQAVKKFSLPQMGKRFTNGTAEGRQLDREVILGAALVLALALRHMDFPRQRCDVSKYNDCLCRRVWAG